MSSGEQQRAAYRVSRALNDVLWERPDGSRCENPNHSRANGLVCEHCALWVMAETERLRDEIADLHDQIAEWQSATGLLNGGDPSGVTPEMLREYIGRLAKIVYGLAEQPVLVLDGDAKDLRRYRQHTKRLIGEAAALKRDYPEE